MAVIALRRIRGWAVVEPPMPLLKPCLEPECTELSDRAKCPKHRPKDTRRNRDRPARTSTDWQWRKLAARTKAKQPWCSICGTTTDLTVDHIIPVSEDPSLAHEPLNLDVLCRAHNAIKGGKCTDEQRNAVYRAIDARKTIAQGM